MKEETLFHAFRSLHRFAVFLQSKVQREVTTLFHSHLASARCRDGETKRKPFKRFQCAQSCDHLTEARCE